MSTAQQKSILQAHQIGQSFWLDYIRRDLLLNGELEQLIAAGEIRGVTSNPSIFEHAIGRSNLYDAAMRPLAHAGWSAERIFESLAVHDIRGAADLFLPLYEGSGGRDGYVSIEVNPQLADDTQATLAEARRLWEGVNRPNLMVKIPATAAGVPAIEQAIAEAINVNVTLIFALDRYVEVMQAYLRGLERRAADDLPLDQIASVASFFVSRVDTAVDRELEQIVREEGRNAPRAAALLGRAAVANAKLAYAQFKSTFGEPRFDRLKERGARVQRPLWASTSTKNPAYSDVLYLEELIGPDTVNTVPPNTLEAFRDHGRAEPRLEHNLSDARAQLEAIEGLGVSLQQVTAQLEIDGVQAFAASYESLIEIVADRAEEMRAELGSLQPKLGALLERLEQDRVSSRYWRADPTLWPRSDGQLVIDFAQEWQSLLPEAERLLEPLNKSELQRIGRLTLGELQMPLDAAFELRRVESLDPAEQRMFQSETPIDSTLFVAITDSTTDAALQAMLAPVWERATNRLGKRAAERFVIAGPDGSQLIELARSRGIPHLAAQPNLAATALAATLSKSGPSALVEPAAQIKAQCAPNFSGPENSGLYLGALLALAQEAGLWRLGLLTDPAGDRLADWLAHRIELSGLWSELAVLRGIPVASDAQDRLLVYLRSTGEQDAIIADWLNEKLPVVVLTSDLAAGGEAVRWEMALGVAAHLIGLSPHPESASQRVAARLAKSYERSRKKGGLKGPRPTLAAADGSVWWELTDAADDAHTSVFDFASALAGRLGSKRILNLGLLRRRSEALDNAVAAVREKIGSLGVDLRLSYGGAPWISGARRHPPGQLTVLLGESARRDQPIPGATISFSQLQLLHAWSLLEELESQRLELGLVWLEAPATIIRWLRALIRELG